MGWIGGSDGSNGRHPLSFLCPIALEPLPLEFWLSCEFVEPSSLCNDSDGVSSGGRYCGSKHPPSSKTAHPESYFLRYFGNNSWIAISGSADSAIRRTLSREALYVTCSMRISRGSDLLRLENLGNEEEIISVRAPSFPPENIDLLL